MKKIYVASSWRNDQSSIVVASLRSVGHEVYDFKNPKEGDFGFRWSEIDPAWRNWRRDEYRTALIHPIAARGFKNDFDAMKWADTCVLVLPCGRSAHTEAGWMAGQGKKVYVLMQQPEEPELMYKIFSGIVLNMHELIYLLDSY